MLVWVVLEGHFTAGYGMANVVQLRSDPRPLPPVSLLEDTGRSFAPANDLAAWASSIFIAEEGVLSNPEHAHLRFAEIGMLWAAIPNSRAGRRIIGQAELGDPAGAMGKWAKARARQQVEEWFGTIPDFLITIDAHYAVECGDAEFCALIEHELMHCAQDRDIYGAPKFRKDGLPVFTIRGHDVEEFIGVVRRYGAHAAGIDALIEAANQRPEVAPARIAHACGTCHRASA